MNMGDLYGLSYLKGFKQPGAGYYSGSAIKKDTGKKIDLWCIGDSFLERAFIPGKADSFLYNTSLKYFFQLDGNPRRQHISFENGKKKILLVESTERNVFIYFSYHENAKKFTKYYITNTGNDFETSKSISLKNKIKTITKWKLVPETIDQNIETLLYGYNFCEPAKELKSLINYQLFNRPSPKVYVSSEKDFLFLSSTIDSSQTESSFKQINENEIDSIVENLNYINDYYKKLGFDSVIFSITPNAVSVEKPNLFTYNNLIDRISKNKKLNAPMINVYDELMRMKNRKDLYWKSDSHWTSAAFSIWVNDLNSFLQKCCTQ